MDRIKGSWHRLPDRLRRLIVLFVGLVLILCAGIIGAIPGPGGMIIFLLAIAVLASEFSWALNLRDMILAWLKRFADFSKSHPIISVAAIVVCILVFWIIAYAFYSYIR